MSVTKSSIDPTASNLGKETSYDLHYNPDRLFPIPRASKRLEIGVDPEHLPFYGFDYWNHYEVSWLNAKGKPIVACAEIVYDASSPNIIESKSLKLYFNSLNFTQYQSCEEVQATVKADLEKAIGAEVIVRIKPLGVHSSAAVFFSFEGACIDDLDVHCSVYSVEPTFLSVDEEVVEETLYSDLLKSNCLVTNQPDWGSVQIEYAGPRIQREGLLQYLVSFRNHNEFHEQCIERIFIDIMNYCKPRRLSVYGRYTRRGGLDINPFRTTEVKSCEQSNLRLIRQ